MSLSSLDSKCSILHCVTWLAFFRMYFLYRDSFFDLQIMCSRTVNVNYGLSIKNHNEEPR